MKMIIIRKFTFTCITIVGKLIIGITGSIAAFKTVQFISDLVKEKYEIEVMLTPSAAKFVTPTSISALTKKKTYIEFL